MKTLGIILTPGVGVTQTTGQDFNSLCRLDDGTVLGANSSGLFKLDSGSDDNGDVIDAFAEFLIQDFGLSQQKRVRKIIIGYEGYGPMMVTVTLDEKYSFTRNFGLDYEDGSQEGVVIPGGRALKGRYITIKISNFNGSDFSVDTVDLILSLLSRKAGNRQIRSLIPPS